MTHTPTENRDTELEDSAVYEIWSIVKKDSLASPRIGSPSFNTRAAIKTIIARERLDELDKAYSDMDEIGKTEYYPWRVAALKNGEGK